MLWAKAQRNRNVVEQTRKSREAYRRNLHRFLAPRSNLGGPKPAQKAGSKSTKNKTARQRSIAPPFCAAPIAPHAGSSVLCWARKRTMPIAITSMSISRTGEGPITAGSPSRTEAPTTSAGNGSHLEGHAAGLLRPPNCPQRLVAVTCNGSKLLNSSGVFRSCRSKLR